MSYIWFQAVLHATGKILNYESVSNMFGRTVFDKKSGEAINRMIEHANPLYKPSTKSSALALMNMPGAMNVIEKSKNQKEIAEKALGDISWFEDILV